MKYKEKIKKNTMTKFGKNQKKNQKELKTYGCISLIFIYTIGPTKI